MTRRRGPDDAQASRPRRSPAALAAATLIAAALFTAFLWLGTWQVHRRAAKHALIAQVALRLATPPAPAPGPDIWRGVTAARDGYRRVALSGRWLPARDTRVTAATALGAGYWLLTPLRDDHGFLILVNRGFVPPEWRGGPPPPGPVAITGLLRMTEPHGGFLRANDPAADRWYSRDVAAIAARRGLHAAAPYFVDAGRAGAGYPVGGLTVVAFPDNHLGYAITWYALAVMTLLGWAVFVRAERRAP